jgi:hypothetical protein
MRGPGSVGVQWRLVSGADVLRTGPVAGVCRNVHCELPQCITSVRMWVGGCNLGLPSLLFVLQS